MGVLNCRGARLSFTVCGEVRNITSQFIAAEMYGTIVNNLAYEPRSS
jgi:hypothetical protein